MDPIFAGPAIPTAVVIFAGAVLFLIVLLMSIAGFAFFVGYLVWTVADFLLRCVAECTADIYDHLRGR